MEKSGDACETRCCQVQINNRRVSSDSHLDCCSNFSSISHSSLKADEHSQILCFHIKLAVHVLYSSAQHAKYIYSAQYVQYVFFGIFFPSSYLTFMVYWLISSAVSIGPNEKSRQVLRGTNDEEEAMQSSLKRTLHSLGKTPFQYKWNGNYKLLRNFEREKKRIWQGRDSVATYYFRSCTLFLLLLSLANN